MKDFADRAGVAVVTGGSGGLGEAVVRTLVERGSRVMFTYRSNEAAAREIAATAGPDALPRRLDLTDAAATRSLLDEVGREEGGIHTVVYASGPHVPMTHLSRVEAEQFADQIGNDVLAFFHLTRAALPWLRGSGGNIVAVTTAATTRYPVRDGLSAVPKGAVEALVRGIAVEEGRYGVRANCVGPGMLTDGMAVRLIASKEIDEAALEAARRNTPLRRFGTATDIAEAVCFLASDRAKFVSGQKLDVDGGYGV
ncbi:SDR family oxidoreductase [Phytohabitans sp. ZYX-F-186]|uniref:SDR family oxidoreductase n=1 Tax=Phytohabitans maris TaxID=3071409 RepID=A0ABU0Z9H8_9ACTN|nr:SDR family oxidoreductase [Phytohabitans sp. ZYX-F-186]MDQ7903705.1 SDR family oxidoreductase [Phytohabitans sp. ZYX-F-186]